MNLGFSKKENFDQFGTKSEGDIGLTELLGLVVKSGGQTKTIVSGDVSWQERAGRIEIGNLLIQFGRVAESGTSFTIDFPEPFGSTPSFAVVQGAGTSPSVFTNPKIDGNNLPTRNSMSVVCEAASGTEYYYWMAIADA